MMRNLSLKLAALFLTVLAAGCSSGDSDSPAPGPVHPEGWVATHASEATADLESCKACHGSDLTGSGQAVSCFTCHVEGPDFSIHPARWGNDPVEEHQHFYNADLLSWTSCAVAACHGSNLQGAQSEGGIAPSCFSADYTDLAGQSHACHPAGPPPPHQLPYLDPNLHGLAARDWSNIGESMLVCRNCHGRPENNFGGGFVADPALLNRPNGDCTACHPAAKAHPTNWQGTNDAADPFDFYASHRAVSATTIADSCALCHNTSGPGAGPMAGAPSCFSDTFTNADGSASSCHAGGAGEAPHAVPFIDPALHGAAAKADLAFCQECHGTTGTADTFGVAGSNPRFNVAIGNLTNGCEGCHSPGTAHAIRERWTFHVDLSAVRRTHFAAGNVLTACALCHGAALDGVGGVAPSCFSCHLSAPQFRLNCSVCHGTPPDGAADLTGGSPVSHVLVPSVPHDTCGRCHGASDDGSGQLAAAGSDYFLFNAMSATLSQGGDHLDGSIEMSGPTPTTGAGYNATTFGCDNACHSGAAPFRLPNASGLTVEYGNYGNEPGGGCTFCHGYPPDGQPDATGSTPVNHLFGDNGATLLAEHNDCLTCHGVKDDGTGAHSPAPNYNVATDHRDGNINMNSDVGYNPVDFGCDAACHANDGTHQLTDSGLPVELGAYGGSGGGSACAACHDTGVGGAPVVVANITPHASGFTCEGCHTGHSEGAVEIPNNPAVGIAYTANGEGGIALGGPDAPGATEAQICWGCHDTYLVSEWGQNRQPATGNAIYNYGQIYSDAATLNATSNWVGAFWKSGTSAFAYKTGQILSTHAANPGAVAAGVDEVGDIRCSYCHDVHELARAPGDTKAGKPYLRGSWVGNLYKEDGAPQSGAVYGNLGRFGRVPRGGSEHSETGGYQIDQNNSNPTAGLTANGSAGLCELCHGNGDGSWTATEINTLNQFGTPGPNSAWVGSNGHANAALGGSGTASGLAANIFRTSDRHTSAIITGTAGAGNPTTAYRHNIGVTGARGYGFRNPSSSIDGASGWNLSPRMADNTVGRPYGFNFYNWGATVDETTTDNQYHRFTCSKCHNPHASRLPRLMITNCLDTKHNTWDKGPGVSTLPSTPSTAGTAISAENANVAFANATSAQNCHRLKDPAFANSRGSGWNRVTPWNAAGQDNSGIQ